MSLALYRRMLSLHLKTMMNYAVGSAFYMVLMLGIYPSIASNSQAIDELVAAMPEGIGRAFNLTSGFGTAQSFISGEYYGLILVLILSVFSVLLATQLIAKLVDQGAMAYLLAAPLTRGKVAFTQASVLVTGLALIMGMTTIAGFAGAAIFLEDGALDSGRFLALNGMAFLLFFAVGGIAFLVSAVSNDEKRALGISGAITFGFFTLDLLGRLSGQLDWLRAVSLFALYRPGEIVEGSGPAPLFGAALLTIGAAAFAIGIVRFRRRDLPL
ncbi:ABC-2 type transport system permease protein [Paenibacillus phyllosphaerae]|uniref:ABC-2 type transport system permease protein n=1 Tax=Paenibacillus phyllosphaerae TaxID=274593 RepID=A0A7W5B0B0_9BACL|nr:ABC transporter permease subunit [Paenibacillus phyllosphaerae]MBB3111917.1 ABC-2 type transport system permease protein [Paenibacillus phyllosphaerae]